MPKPPPQRSPGGSRKRVTVPPGVGTPAIGAAAPTAWEAQAQWYNELVGEHGNDLYTSVLLPRILERLAAKPGERVLDVCCGQGVLGRALAATGITVVGVDAAPSLIAAARERASAQERYVVGDARRLADAGLTSGPEGLFNHAALIMALADLDAPNLALAGVSALIKPGGRVIVAMTHPCFRIPKRSRWEDDLVDYVRYRRVDCYLTPVTVPIRTHPGRGEDSPTTAHFHRPLSAYVNAMGANRLAVVAMDELISPRRGSSGRASAMEEAATREFPLFVVFTAVRI